MGLYDLIVKPFNAKITKLKLYTNTPIDNLKVIDDQSYNANKKFLAVLKNRLDKVDSASSASTCTDSPGCCADPTAVAPTSAASTSTDLDFFPLNPNFRFWYKNPIIV